MIEIKDAVKRFGSFAALDGVTLTVPQGSVYGLVGPNGAGKSTLIRCLTGIYRADAGTISIDGGNVWENEGLKARTAAIPDDWYYLPQATIRDMCRFMRGDEPVDGLDPVMRRQVWSLVLGDVAQRGTTVLVSSHNLRELEDVCDHVGILDHGRVLLERSLAQLQDNMVKLQVVFRDGGEVPADLPVLHASRVGRVHTLIMRMSAGEAQNLLSVHSPLLVDAVPLTLEEIFIYELGGADYAVKDIVL